MTTLKKVLPEEFASKVRSKQDLYKLLTLDLHYLLPPFNICPLHYLRKVLNGEKKMLKQTHVVEIIVPRYAELRVENIWPLVKENEDLMNYFPDYSQKQLPDRKFMYLILATLRFDELKGMIDGARKNRARIEEKLDDNFIQIEKDLYNEISSVMKQKTTKGKAVFLLKKASKLERKRKQPKKYELQFSDFGKEERKENEEEGDDMK